MSCTDQNPASILYIYTVFGGGMYPGFDQQSSTSVGTHIRAQPNRLLRHLQHKGYVFKGSQPANEQLSNEQTTSTGYLCLDKALQGGLKVGQLHEVQLPQVFSGESHFLAGPIEYARQQDAPTFWLNPPAQPCLQGLQSLQRCFVINELSSRELQWTAQQLLHTLKSAVIFIWHPQPDVQMVRSWQRAIQKSPNVFALVFSGYMPNEARAYQNRIQLCLSSSQLHFEVLKRQGGWPTTTEPLTLQAVHL